MRSAAQVARDHLRATGNHAVGGGDAGLLHEICELLGRPHNRWTTEKLILDSIQRTNRGEFVRFKGERGRRVFYLAEFAEDWMVERQKRESEEKRSKSV